MKLCRDAVPAEVVGLLDELVGEGLTKGFALAGGTSLALRYGHRLSVDLDFFTCDGFDPEQLRNSLPGEVQELGRSVGSLSCVLRGAKVDFLRHDYPMLAEIEVVEGVSLYSVPDVVAMKLNAVTNRGSKKDFFDLVELLKCYSLDEMLGFFEEKYRGSDRLMVLRSLSWFEDAEREPEPVVLNEASWEQVKREISRAVSGL
jgi:predicted nucleotidyltransferase component of viral defense system